MQSASSTQLTMQIGAAAAAHASQRPAPPSSPGYGTSLPRPTIQQQQSQTPPQTPPLSPRVQVNQGFNSAQNTFAHFCISQWFLHLTVVLTSYSSSCASVVLAAHSDSCSGFRTLQCEGLPGVYSTIWCLCYKTNELKKKGKKETVGRVKWAK
jgi:hypothetical protein